MSGSGGRVYGAPSNWASSPVGSSGYRGFSPVYPPGVGNINHPGLPPSTPVGGAAGHPYRNPGYRYGRGVPGVVVAPSYGYGYGYGVPYAPYYFGPDYGPGYTTDYGAGYSPDYSYQAAPPQTELIPAEPEEPAQQEGAPAGPRLYYVTPEATGGEPDSLQTSSAEPEPPQPATPAATPAAKPKPVTLIAFKDQTVVAVTDYWLKGETFYYLKGGTETGIPFGQLDLLLTQQLNFERHVPFILESRP